MGGAIGVLTWNVAGRLSRLDEQADRVIAHRAGVICLQEVIPNALARWTSRLQSAGYAVTVSTVLPGADHSALLATLAPAADGAG